MSRVRLQDPRLVSCAVAFLAVLALGVWIISPRFSITGPSIVDDWSALENSPRALDQLTSLSYNPDEVRDSHRYRPGYVSVWNSLQWHTLGAPDSLTGPNAWNLFRLALFIAALVIVVAAVVGGSRQPRIGPLWLGILAAAPAALVLATPKTGEDFARFGPVEPVLVGAMTLGATMLVFVTGRAIGSTGGSSKRNGVTTAALAICGYALWLLGVYQKEASVCFLALAPFLYLFLAQRWRESGLIDKPLYRYRAFLVAAVAMLLPVLHMAVEIIRLAGEGTTVYGATVPKGTGGIVDRLRSSFDLQWESITSLLETSFWKGMAIFLPFLVLWVALRRRRIPWLAIGLVAAGWAAFVFQGLSGTATARYYIPTMALFGLAAALLLAESRVWPRLACVAIGALFVLSNANFSNGTVESWASGDRDGNRAMSMVADLNPDRCPVYMSGLEEEVADAFPELVALERPFPAGACYGRYAAFMLRRQQPERITPVTNEAILEACAGRGWQPYNETRVWRIYSCRRLRSGSVDGQPIEDILDEDRLEPGRRFSEYRS